MTQNKIYILDDNRAVCDSLNYLFDAVYHVPVEIYYDPLDFLAAYSLDWKGCLFIDLCLPHMDGIEVLHELKQRQNKIPCIFITGHGDLAAKEQALKNGAYAFLTKPFKIDDINNILKVLILDTNTVSI
jgi:FixJ family two-component response regulator